MIRLREEEESRYTVPEGGRCEVTWGITLLDKQCFNLTSGDDSFTKVSSVSAKGVRVEIEVEVAAGERFWTSSTVSRFEKVVWDEAEQDAF